MTYSKALLTTALSRSEKRTTLGSVHSLSELGERSQNLNGNQHKKVIEHIEGDLKIVLMGAGYITDDA
jgi:hypothetical protein